MGWLLDRLVLRNSRHPLEAEGARRSWLQLRGRKMELFQWDVAADPIRRAAFHVIKFVGAAGRAENVTPHPFEMWPEAQGTVSVANPPGYGASPGQVRLEELVPLGLDTVRHVTDSASPPILLTGNSLGGAVSICVAAAMADTNLQPAALIVRDPPHLADVIWHRFGWKSGGLPAAMVGRHVPSSLDVYASAAACRAPAVFVSSRKDRVVPPAVQDKLIEHYAGPKRVIQLPDAGHYDPMTDSELKSYGAALAWLWSQVFPSTGD